MLEFWADPSSPYHRDEFQPERRVILHCASGGRSALAAQTLQELGYSNVAQMDGGITAWNDSGRPVAHEHDFGHSARLSGRSPQRRNDPPRQSSGRPARQGRGAVETEGAVADRRTRDLRRSRRPLESPSRIAARMPSR